MRTVQAQEANLSPAPPPGLGTWEHTCAEECDDVTRKAKLSGKRMSSAAKTTCQLSSAHRDHIKASEDG